MNRDVVTAVAGPAGLATAALLAVGLVAWAGLHRVEVPAVMPLNDRGIAIAAVDRGENGSGSAPASAGATFADPAAMRPDFLSETESQVLQGVAARHADSAKVLAQLVAKLRFARAQESWRALAGSANSAARDALAEQLLRDLPAQVADESLDIDDARRLQAELLGQLVPDPAARAMRAEREARRLQVLVAPVPPAS